MEWREQKWRGGSGRVEAEVEGKGRREEGGGRIEGGRREEEGWRENENRQGWMDMGGDGI